MTVDPAAASVPEHVRAAVAARTASARRDLARTVARRRAMHERLARSTDPDDQAVARVYLDYLRQAQEVERSGAALVVAAGATGDPVVGRMAIFDDDRDVSLVSWHSPAGQAHLLADDRLLVTERPDGEVDLHTLQADDVALAGRIREQMRTSARQDRMSDPLATLTIEQGQVLRQVGRAPGPVVLHGPPGSGKSAIVMVELARRVLSDADPARFRALFVTGTDRLATRATSLGRLLGTASILPVPQRDLLSFVGVSDEVTPAADDRAAVASLALPRAIEATFAELAARLHAEVEVPHPLGPVPADEVAAVRRWRARSASTPYRTLARGLARDLRDEYARVWPGDRGREAADAAAARLRPDVTPSGLVAQVAGGVSLPRALRAAAVAGSSELLSQPGGRPRRRWDLVVVDEYQRLPGLVVWLLERWAGRLVLSGDPWQSFSATGVTEGIAGADVVSLRTSLRLPSVIGDWVDDRFRAADLPAPAVRCAVEGGAVRRIKTLDEAAPDTQVIGPAGRVHDRDGWLTPAEAVGLEWPEVVLLDPDRILADHGPAGLFIAATRAIDTLHVAP